MMSERGDCVVLILDILGLCDYNTVKSVVFVWEYETISV